MKLYITSFYCPPAQMVWHQLGINHLDGGLYSFHENTSLKLSNFVLNQHSIIGQIHPHILIPYALWHIWKSRNRNILEGTHHYPNLPNIIGHAPQYQFLVANTNTCNTQPNHMYVNRTLQNRDILS